MNEEMANMMKNFSTMFQQGNTATNASNNDVVSNNQNQSTSSTEKENGNNQNTGSFTISPEMINNVMNMFHNANSDSSSTQSSESTNTTSSNPGIDIGTIMKMKSIMDKMNHTKDDPRSNLLLSLKPYLRDSRKEKVEQYIKIFNMSKVIDILGPNGGDKSK